MIPNFEKSTFSHDGIQHTLYTRGKGPGIVVIHELPGLTGACISLANRLVEAGYRVYMPLLFGKPVKKAKSLRTLGYAIQVCISREFKCFAANKTSPIVDWLRAVCRMAHEECGGPGVGAIGMCLTGNFAISLMADEWMLAPVSCEPSLPLPFGKNRKRGLAMNPDELNKAKARAAAGQDLVCLRFSCDRVSPGARFERLAKEFGSAFKGTQIDSSPGNPDGISKKAHSVLTADFVDRQEHPTRQALDQVLAFFNDRLLQPSRA